MSDPTNLKLVIQPPPVLRATVIPPAEFKTTLQVGQGPAGKPAPVVSVGDGGQIAYSSLSGLPTLGTASPLNVAASGNAAAGEVVKGDDTRLSDSREWSAATIDQAEAEAGTATIRRAWTAERVKQAVAAWCGTTLKTINGESLIGPGDIQVSGGGAFAGASNVEIDNGDLTLIVNAAPVTPPADTVKLFGKKMGGGRVMPAAVGPSGVDYALMPSMWRQKVGLWTPPGNATTVPGVLGTTAWTAVGTATARSVATTNLLTRMRRLGYVSAATAGSLTSIRTAQAQYTTGNGAGLGGFFASFRFAITDAAEVSGARQFVGMTSSTAAPTNVEPSTLKNCIGVAQLSTDATQLYLVYGGSAAQTAVALGTNFPPMAGTGIANGIAYDLAIWCPPNSNGVINWTLERIGTSFSTSGTITPATPGTQTPASTTLMNPVVWRCNNATAAAVAFDLISFYIETDY